MISEDPDSGEAAPPQEEPIAQQERTQGSVLGLRVALWSMAGLTGICGVPAMTMIPGLEHAFKPDPPLDEMHSTALLVILAFGTALPVYLLAAIHVGLTGRGMVYLGLSVPAFAIQMVLALNAQAFLGIITFLPAAIAGIFALYEATRADIKHQLANPRSRKLILWPDLVVIPASIALVAVLIGHIDAEYVPGEPNTPREFDSSEGWQRLDAVVQDSLSALEAVEGFAVARGPDYRDYSGLNECEHGAARDEEWVDLQIVYRFGELEPDSELSLAYMESLKESWTEHGYTITGDSSAEAATGDQSRGYRVSAATDEGITISYTVGYGQAKLEARTGCILKIGEIDTVDPL
ncbi:hypothetical protein [Glycomyces buryatensis]|uniref:Uncharacterized protein n=1 Tax=Glycomyces buryatensis TaxID=2570927 RepID=A0A4S8QD11_9ACTN|nr:hypothetical protein [Glycomyces buryatensis]THV42413.1 hypothetical protein FAB82_07100 [Glycomyces buryatensis]